MKTASPSQPSDTLTDTVDVHLRRLKNGFFGVLFIVNKDEDGGHWIWSALESLIDHFQDLSIPLGFRPFRWQHEVEWLNFTFDIFSPEKFVSTSEGLYIALISILALVLINTLWVGYSFSTNRFRFIWTLKFLRFTLDLFATVLYIPILERFTHTIVRCKHSSLFGEDTEDDELPSVDWHECWTGPYLFKSVITLIVAIIFICLVHAVGATFFKFDPHTKDVEARPHSRIETLYIAIRTVLIILSIVMATYGVPHSMLNRGIFAGVCIVGTGILAFSYIWYIPYYHYKFSVFRSSLQMNFFWMSLCGTYNLFRPRSDIGIIFILLMPVAILLGCLLTQIRRRAIERLDPEKAGALQVELHVRFKLEAAGLLFKDPPKSNITMAAASPGDLSSAAETSRGPTNRVLTESEILDEITEIYNLALRANPHSSLLHLFAGQFYLLRLGNRAQCMASLAKAENLEPKIDEMCMIFRRQRLLNERFSGGDVIDFIAYEQNMLLAKKYARRAEAAVVQFWAELLHRQPSFRRLHHHGAALTTAISNAQQHYTQILKLSPNSPYAYRLYAGFLINVLNDNKQGEQLIEMADELEGDARKGGSQQFNEFNEDEPENNINVGAWADNALVTISGELDNLGHVLNVNQVWLKLFGYKKHEILHQNIDKIVPSPFGEMHDLLLKRYLDTGRAKVIDRPRQVLGVTGHGTLISVTLCVKQITSPEGRISFLGLMNRARTRPGEEFMILDNSFGVLHGTENLTNIFGYSSRGMPVGQWIKGLDYEMVVKAGRSGYRTDVETAHKRYQLLITGDKVEVAAAACYICRVHMSEGVPVHEVGVPPGLQAPLAASGPHYSEGSVGGCPMGFAAGSLTAPSDSPLNHPPRPHTPLPPLHPPITDPNAITGPQTPPGNHLSPNTSYSGLPLSFSPHASHDNVSHSSRVGGTSSSVSGGNQGKETIQLTRRPSRAPCKPSTMESPQRDRRYSRADNDDDDDAQSTGSSMSRGGSSSSYIKNVIALKNIQTSRQLEYLRSAFIVGLLILGVLSVTENVRFKDLYGGVTARLDEVRMRGNVGLNLAKILESVRSIEVQAGAGGGIDSAIANATSAREALQQDTEQMLSMVGYFVDLLPGTKPYAEVDIYGSSPINPSTYVVRESRTVFDSLQETINNVRHILEPATDPAGVRSAMDYIYLNAPASILFGLNASTAEAAHQYKTDIEGTRVAQLGRSTAGPAWWFAVFLILIWPLYIKIQTIRQKFFQMFLDIPKEVVKGIYSSHLQRLAEAEEDEDDMDMMDAGNRFALDKLLHDEESGFGGDPDVDAMLPRGADESRMPSLRRGSLASTGIVSRALNRLEDPHHILPKAFLVLMLCLAYFFSAGGITYAWLTENDHVAADAYWAVQVPVLARLADLRVREDVLRAYGYVDSGSLALFSPVPGRENGTGLLSTLYSVQRGIMYGSDIMGTASSASHPPDPKLANLMLYNACIEGTPEDCNTFLNGILTNGLHAGVSKFIQLAREVETLLPPPPSLVISTGTTLPANVSLRLTQVRTLDMQYLPAPLNLAAAYRVTVVDSHASWFKTFHLTFTVVFCTMLGAAYFFVFRPLVMALSEDNRRTHVMLYMIPPEILSKVESIRLWAAVPGTKRTIDRPTAKKRMSKTTAGGSVEMVNVARTVEIV